MDQLPSKLKRIEYDLAGMYQQDQDMRNQHLFSEEDTWDPSIDKQNTERLKDIIREIGWPTISLVGRETAMQAWLLAQHADHDPEFQAHCLELMRKCPDGEVEKSNIAYLEDRIRIKQGKSQLYGTQFQKNSDGKLEALPIEDPEGLEKRRLQMEMESFQANQKRIQETYCNRDSA